MIIVVRVGLGLAYQGASSAPQDYRRRCDYYRDPPISAISFGGGGGGGGRNSNRDGQISTFQAASRHDNNDGLQSISLGTSLSGTKLDTSIGMTTPGTGSRSELRVADGDERFICWR
jgi:hypothetical protein